MVVPWRLGLRRRASSAGEPVSQWRWSQAARQRGHGAASSGGAGFFRFSVRRSAAATAAAQSRTAAAVARHRPRGAGAARAPERVNEGAGSTGHTVAFCVRLCDGQHFPLEQMGATRPRSIPAAQSARAARPRSSSAPRSKPPRASDGTHYADLKTAFLYRKQLVANCTCNGRDAFGLVSIDVKTDPTLRPGDVVSTKEGLETFNGKSGKSAAFTPVTPAALGPQLNSITSPQGAAAAAAADKAGAKPAANPAQR